MKNKYPIKRVLFQKAIKESFFGGEVETDKVLFDTNKWYNVEFETPNGLIYLITDANEKIAIDVNDLKGIILIQR